MYDFLEHSIILGLYLYWKSQNYWKRTVKYTNLWYNSVHVIHEKVTHSENCTVCHCFHHPSQCLTQEWPWYKFTNQNEFNVYPIYSNTALCIRVYEHQTSTIDENYPSAGEWPWLNDIDTHLNSKTSVDM